jgi:hypothetical protein
MKNKNVSGSTSVRVICVCHPKMDFGILARRNKKLIRILESFVVLPAIALSMPFGFFGSSISKTAELDISPQIVLAQQNMEATSILALNKAVDEKEQILAEQAKAIDAYFRARKLPFEGTGAKMAKEADKYGLDYRLMPAIAMIETTGGKFACPYTYKITGDKGYTYNAFGWGSCKISFKSKDHAIEVIARNLSGNNPNTEKHYSGKTTEQILKIYNPPSVKPHYARDVMAIMEAIGEKDIGLNQKERGTIVSKT